jgi:hypothetical protein
VLRHGVTGTCDEYTGACTLPWVRTPSARSGGRALRHRGHAAGGAERMRGGARLCTGALRLVWRCGRELGWGQLLRGCDREAPRRAPTRSAHRSTRGRFAGRCRSRRGRPLFRPYRGARFRARRITCPAESTPRGGLADHGSAPARTRASSLYDSSIIGLNDSFASHSGYRPPSFPRPCATGCVARAPRSARLAAVTRTVCATSGFASDQYLNRSLYCPHSVAKWRAASGIRAAYQASRASPAQVNSCEGRNIRWLCTARTVQPGPGSVCFGACHRNRERSRTNLRGT